MAFIDREHEGNRETRLYAEHKASNDYLTSLRNASLTGFPIRYAEEAAIHSRQDYSTWILSSADSDLFMRSLLDTPSRHAGSRVSSHRHKRNAR
jgi:hypothetical protein